MKVYQCTPRNQNEVIAELLASIEEDPSTLIFGFEWNRPDPRCPLAFNFNAQHEKGMFLGSCVTEVLSYLYLNQLHLFERDRQIIAVTSRLDADALAAIALFERFLEKGELNWDLIRQNVMVIHDADCYSSSSTPWVPASLFTRGFLSSSAGPVAALADSNSLSVEEKVRYMDGFLHGRKLPIQCYEEYDSMVHRMQDMLFSNDGRFSRRFYRDSIAYVQLPGEFGRLGASLGYAIAPVVVVEILDFVGPYRNVAPYRKFSLFSWNSSDKTLTAAYAFLSTLEEGWNGGPHAGGSPEGVSSRISTEDVLDAVYRHCFCAQSVTA